jgi:hypothetical protein
VFIFLDLDYTSVSRIIVLFYPMLIWLAISAHFLPPNRGLTKVRLLGLAIAMLGVSLAFMIGQSALPQALQMIFL